MPNLYRFATLLLILCVVSPVDGASPSELIREGNEAYRNKLFDKSIQSYRKALEQAPTSPIVQYNLGTALAQKGELDESMAVLGQAADGSEGEMRAKSLYNLGVTMTEETEKSQNPEPSKQIAGLKQALGSFKQAVLENPLDYEAKHNYEVLLKRIKRMEQQQQQQQQGDGEGNPDQNQQDGDKQNQQQNQDGQGQSQENSGQNNQQQGQQNPPENQQGNQGEQDQQDQPEQQPESGDEGEENEEQNEGESGQNEGQMTPSQMDAQRLLNLLEQQDPDQFKKLFQQRGGSGERPPKNAW